MFNQPHALKEQYRPIAASRITRARFEPVILIPGMKVLGMDRKGVLLRHRGLGVWSIRFEDGSTRNCHTHQIKVIA